jgi:hypothetical protein
MLTDSKGTIKEALLSSVKNQSSEVLSGVRGEALAALDVLEIPTSKNEEWKYTDFNKALKKNFDFSQSGKVEQTLSSVEQYKFQGLDAAFYHFFKS